MSGVGTAGVIPRARTTSPAQRRAALLSNLFLACLGFLFLAPMLWLFAASVDEHASWSLSLPTFTLEHLADSPSLKVVVLHDQEVQVGNEYSNFLHSRFSLVVHT